MLDKAEVSRVLQEGLAQMTGDEFERVARTFSPELLQTVHAAEAFRDIASFQAFVAQFPNPTFAMASIIAEVMDDSASEEFRNRLAGLVDRMEVPASGDSAQPTG